MTDNLCNAFCIDGCPLLHRRLRGGIFFALFSQTNQIESRPQPVRKVDRISMSVDMHEEDARIIPEEVIVQSGDLNAVFKECRHDLIHLAFGEDEIAHDNVFTTIPLLHRKPAAESEWGGESIIRNFHVQIISRNVYFQHICFVVALLTDDLQHLLVVTRDFLGSCNVSECRDNDCGQQAPNWWDYSEFAHCVSFLTRDSFSSAK